MSSNDPYILFTDAMKTINDSLEHNRGKGVFGKLIEGFDKFADGHVTGVALYDSDPSQPYDYFTVRYIKGHFEVMERGKGDHKLQWKVSKAYLQSLRDNPKEYIEHPAKMDLDWMKSVLPDTLSSLFNKAA
jgi:hypothetical protein